MAQSGWNDNKAHVNENGYLTLGKGFGDVPFVGGYPTTQQYGDNAQDATFLYAKGDAEFPVIASELIGDTLPALTFDGTRTAVPKRTLAASTTHKVIVPFHSLLRTYAAVGHGTLINSFSLFYRVNTNDLTSVTMELDYETLAAAASLAAPTTPAGTVTGNTVTQAANIYEMKFAVTTPAWYTTTGIIPYGLVTIVTPGSCTCDLFGATWRCSYAVY